MSSILNLKAGDLIDVIAPSSRCPDQELAAGCAYLESLGFRVRVPKEIFSSHPYLAHQDKIRFAQLKKALLARDSQAIWCARGGYGAGRLMPDLMKMKKPAHPKALIGLSDITALHIWLNCAWKWPSWHAPILSRLGSARASEEERAALRAVLVEGQHRLQFPDLNALNVCAQKWQSRKKSLPLTSRSLVGGNLVLVESGVGTAWQIKAEDRILFLEDAGERGYRLDRSLNHLAQAGVFNGVTAIVLGDFTGGDEPSGENFVDRTLRDFFNSLSAIPVFRGVKSGHGPIQLPLPFGVSTRIENAVSPTLIFEF